VDKAIIFFISHSAIALYPAISIVIEAINNSEGVNMGDLERNG
jgi:hypothetical protein